MKEKFLAKMLVLLTRTRITSFFHSSLMEKYGINIGDDSFIIRVETRFDEHYQSYEHFIITVNKGIYGIYREIPDGYSEYTYEPQCSFDQYPEYDALKFISFALTQDERDAMYNQLTKKEEE